MTVRAISYGGGVQSTALVVLAAQRRIDCQLAIFANVGEKAENPATLDYVRRIAMPFCAHHGIELVEVNRGGKWPDLFERLTHPDSRFIGIPIRLTSGAPGNRTCTHDYKMITIGHELKRRGASNDDPAEVLIGISTDEAQRANKRRREPHESIHYPLLDLGLSRLDCRRVIRMAGLPIPEKSSCWFCPFHTPAAWTRMRTDNPEQFERAAQLEDELNRRRRQLSRDPVYLTDALIPLRRAVMDSDALDLDLTAGECDSGWCMT